MLFADLRAESAETAAEVLSNAGFEVSVATADVSSREAVHALVETATGDSPKSALTRRRPEQDLDKNRGPGAYCPDHRNGVKLPDDFAAPVTPLQYVDEKVRVRQGDVST